LGMDEVIGFSDQWLEDLEDSKSESIDAIQKPVDSPLVDQMTVEQETLACVKCGALNVVDASECKKCGIIFAKFQEQKEDPQMAKAPQKLKEIWQMVINHYEDEDLHEEFLRQCRKAQQLEFASSRYQKILAVQPHEEMAKKCRDKIIAMASLPAARATENVAKRKFRVPFTSLAMLMSAIVMFLGYIRPEFRNLMGIGAAFLFITTAIRLIFKN
ncbi:MAG: hypothetical protein KDD40_08815, partial [Bdellovibrionales bacterium]|nr:hypothetical protein [Bdellovibrionales bacterium]